MIFLLTLSLRDAVTVLAGVLAIWSPRMIFEIRKVMAMLRYSFRRGATGHGSDN
jgi:hypothetical protein